MASSVEHLRQAGGAQANVQHQQSAGAQPVNQAECDPIYRFKLLLPRLKESLVVCMAYGNVVKKTGIRTRSPESLA